MSPDKWQNIIGNIKDKFKVEEYDHEYIDEHGGIETEFIIFTGPLGRMKLEFITKPLILDKKTIYSRRIGSETTVDYVYSEDEKNYILKAYQWNETDEDWAEIDAKSFD